jgi:exopolysaccharide biosynthesis predicted pyruvyltransferase EpsI
MPAPSRCAYIAIVVALFLCLIALFQTGTVSSPSSLHLDDVTEFVSSPFSSYKDEAQNKNTQHATSSSATASVSATASAAPSATVPAVVSNVPISYDKTTPPSTGCEAVVNAAQHKLISEYQQLLKGIRYVNVWGYLETENKGDAAIWSAQQILLSMMGIETMEACRFMDKGCNMTKFTQALEDHKPNSAIIMAGGGNFNDYYWEDQPSRMQMIKHFTQVPIRAFPQSIHMTHNDRINDTKKAFLSHPNLQLAARDAPSYKWLADTFEGEKVAPASTDLAVTDGIGKGEVKTVLTPDIAFMWGSRPDFRINTPKEYDILILARDDMEISTGNSKSIPFGKGNLDLGGSIGNVSYWKVDWKFTPTPEIDNKEHREMGKNQRAWAKATEGFRMLGAANFVITDRLHGHILSTLIGTPHVVMDSKLGKNINYHDTWTKDCACTRVAEDIDEAQDFAKMFFEKERNEGRWNGELVHGGAESIEEVDVS